MSINLLLSGATTGEKKVKKVIRNDEPNFKIDNTSEPSFWSERNKGKVQIESNGPTEITVYKLKPREVLTGFVQEEKYQGDVVNDIREGKGKMTYANGGEIFFLNLSDIYEGDWKNDQPNGKGIFTFEDGTKYIGEFKNNHIEGEGERTYPNGDKFIGQVFD
jgi:hypothetical protein